MKLTNDNNQLIYLNSLTLEDVSLKYLSWLNNPQVNQFLETRFETQSIESISDYIQKSLNTNNEYLFAIRTIEGNEHIGNIKLGPINNNHKIGDISLFIGDTNFWGKGVAVEAINTITKFAFEQLDLYKISAGAYAENTASTKAFIKAGYKKDGIRKNHFLFQDKYSDLVYVSIENKKLNV
ncbi:Protein N-acetyltransferase, RimJ/RimL family [Pseudoalteromonas sp. DSM 26666]|uniref:GNAT family N-acetyltransferase n=1 Tax=Pseudoalteromonas sp. DSM 26666 TaxID=1761892 RepID=UPI0008E09EF1|nr:GNAT family protein [Pseudoalteromonas sp. DSM 26666]SFT90692.1 Protein N-acetyltransferase, RimJ/RimL family [Pseudoalteromonas sp. DSM 26666]